MARLIFESVTVSPTGGDANSSTINEIVTESVSMSEEMIQVAIEDNQNVTEGFTTTGTFRTKRLTYSSGVAVGDPILDPSSSVANDTLVFAGGSNSLQKARIRFNGVNGGSDFYVDGVYLMGRRVYDNGREEVEVSFQIDTTQQKIVPVAN